MQPEPAPQTELSFVVPVYDEEQNLERLFGSLAPFAESLGRTFEIVCVDDGSRDGSPAMLASAASRDPRVRVITFDCNRGKGAAVRAGVLDSRGAVVMFLDADLATDLCAVPRAIAALEDGCDAAFGNRHGSSARLLRRQPRVRELLGEAFRVGARAAFSVGVTDLTCGFKAFRAGAARAVFSRLRIDRWAFDLEIAVVARELGLRVAQIDVLWQHHDPSKVRLAPAVLGALLDLARVAYVRATGGYSGERRVRAQPHEVDGVPSALPSESVERERRRRA